MAREGVLMVMFDLPTATKEERREYGKFRRQLKKLGYLMLQESVYVKHIRNTSSIDREVSKVDLISPSQGSVAALKLTVNQFETIDIIRGDNKFESIYSPVLYF